MSIYYGHNPLEFSVAAYSVAQARDGLPGLIDKAMAGEEVIITRHGKPVAELRSAPAEAPAPRLGVDWLASGRLKPKPGTPNSVELLNMIYEDPEG
jgi:prevent-host-death family protein